MRSGKTRYVGFSNFDQQPPLLRRAVAVQKARGWERVRLEPAALQPGRAAGSRASTCGFCKRERHRHDRLLAARSRACSPTSTRAESFPKAAAPPAAFKHFLERGEGAHSRECRGGRALRGLGGEARARHAGAGGARVGAAAPGGLERDHRRHAGRSARGEPQGGRDQAEPGEWKEAEAAAQGRRKSTRKRSRGPVTKRK